MYEASSNQGLLISQNDSHPVVNISIFHLAFFDKYLHHTITKDITKGDVCHISRSSAPSSGEKSVIEKAH